MNTLGTPVLGQFAHRIRLLVILTPIVALAHCGAPAGQPSKATLRPEYNRQTGRLERLDFDRDADGKLEGRAFMDGAIVKRIEIDANRDGTPDRWEYYGSDDPGVGSAGSRRSARIVRVEQSTRHDGTVSRWEYWEHGVVARVEEDVDGDGRIDKWERYANGSLASVELDLAGTGKPDRRLVYDTGGSLIRIESDGHHDGRFEPVP